MNFASKARGASCHMGHVLTAIFFLFLLTALRLSLAEEHPVPPSSFSTWTNSEKLAASVVNCEIIRKFVLNLYLANF